MIRYQFEKIANELDEKDSQLLNLSQKLRNITIEIDYYQKKIDQETAQFTESKAELQGNIDETHRDLELETIDMNKKHYAELAELQNNHRSLIENYRERLLLRESKDLPSNLYVVSDDIDYFLSNWSEPPSYKHDAYIRSIQLSKSRVEEMREQLKNYEFEWKEELSSIDTEDISIKAEDYKVQEEFDKRKGELDLQLTKDEYDHQNMVSEMEEQAEESQNTIMKKIREARASNGRQQELINRQRELSELMKWRDKLEENLSMNSIEEAELSLKRLILERLTVENQSMKARLAQ